MGQDPHQPLPGDRPLASSTTDSKEEVIIPVIIPVIVEELVVLTMEQDTGGVRAVKTVKEREQVVDRPLLREQVTVERKTIQRILDAPAQVRQEGDTTIIPVMEEVLVVSRQFLLKEEIHIKKTQTWAHEPQRFTVRSEEVTVEQLAAKDKL